MKNLKIILTEKDWKIIKNYLVNFPIDEKIRYSQNDYMIWIINNLPKHPKKFHPNYELLEILENPKNLKGLSQEKIERLKLIGKGIIDSDTDENDIIEKMMKGK